MNWLVEKKTYRFSTPLETSARTFHSRDVVEVRETLGLGGLGEAAPLSGWGKANLDELLQELQGFVETGAPIRSACARFAADSARHDADARSKGVPLWRLLAERFNLDAGEALLLNGTVGGGESFLKDAEVRVGGGFRCLKMKVGLLTPELDIQRVRTIRDRFPDVRLRLDANGAWSVDEANQMFDRLKNLAIDYVEQPCSELSEIGELERHGVRVALDESIVEAADFDHALNSDLAEVFVLKPAQIGSFEEIVSCVRAAEKNGIEVVFSSSLDSIGRFVAAHLARALGLRSPCGLATGSWLEDGLADPLIPGEHGMKWGFSELPGLGLPEERYV